MVEREVKIREKQEPSGLSLVEFPSCPKVLQVFVVCPDLQKIFCAFKEVVPLFQSSDDCQHLLVIDIIVPFHCAQGLGIKSHWVPLPIFLQELG
jgi:hypothetical protein